MRHILAIDAGTSGVRALIVDERGRPVAAAYDEFRTEYPTPGWAQQDGEHIWLTVRSVIGRALAGAGITAQKIAAIGIANQRSSLMAWDARDLRPITPMILWHDVRTVARCQELTGQGFYVTANMSAGKADWIMRNVREARTLADAGSLRLGGMESWLCSRLSGGCHVTDHANASSTGLYAHFERTWDRSLLQAIGVGAEGLPTLVDSSAAVSHTSEAVFGAAVPIAAMCGDQQASLYGLECHEVGQTKCSYGTSAMVDVNSGASVSIGGTGTYPLVAWSIGGSPTYCVEGNVVTAGAAVQWLRDGLGVVADASQTSELAASVKDSGGVWAVPAFQGLGTPIMEAQARAVIGGLSRGSGRAHLVRAVLEGIAQRVADAAEAVSMAVAPLSVLRADGGASRNDFLLQTQANLLGVPVERSAVSDGAAMGAAALAARGANLLADDASFAAWRCDRVFEPGISQDERNAARTQWASRVELAQQAVRETDRES